MIYEVEVYKAVKEILHIKADYQEEAEEIALGLKPGEIDVFDSFIIGKTLLDCKEF